MAHEADHKSYCGRCKSYYYTCEGECEYCADLSDEELDEYFNSVEEAAVSRYEDSLEPDDDTSDQAQADWESWRSED